MVVVLVVGVPVGAPAASAAAARKRPRHYAPRGRHGHGAGRGRGRVVRSRNGPRLHVTGAQWRGTGVVHTWGQTSAIQASTSIVHAGAPRRCIVWLPRGGGVAKTRGDEGTMRREVPRGHVWVVPWSTFRVPGERRRYMGWCVVRRMLPWKRSRVQTNYASGPFTTDTHASPLAKRAGKRG